MATMSISNNKSNSTMAQFIKITAIVILVGGIFIGMLGLLWFTQTPLGAPVAESLWTLFEMGTVQAWWYVTRASGLTAYLLLWFSMVWGLAISTKILNPTVEGTYSFDFHEFLSLLGLSFVLLHVIVLLFDQFLPFSVWQIATPFINSYRPLWVGLGIIGFYVFLLVTVTFYMRQVIGTKAFRSIHILSLVGYLGATLHGLFAGTDSALLIAKLLYAGTFLVVTFLVVYWLVLIWFGKREQHRLAGQREAAEGSQRLRPTQR